MADVPPPKTPVAARAKPADEPRSSAKKLLSSVRMKQMAGVNLPQYRMFRIPVQAVVAQYNEIQYAMPRGMFILPDETRLRVWHGVLFVPPDGVFANHVVAFTLTIPDTFPAKGAAPEILFQQSPPHPLIQPGSGLFALEHFLPRWELKTPLAQALKAVKTAFVPSARALDNMCRSESVLDPRTAEAMIKDFETMLAMIKGLASKSRENVVTTDAEDGAKGSRMAKGGFVFTPPKPGHTELMAFLAERSRKASEIFDFVQSFEARGGGSAGSWGPADPAGAKPAAPASAAAAAAAASTAAAAAPAAGVAAATTAAAAAAGTAAVDDRSETAEVAEETTRSPDATH